MSEMIPTPKIKLDPQMPEGYFQNFVLQFFPQAWCELRDNGMLAISETGDPLQVRFYETKGNWLLFENGELKIISFPKYEKDPHGKSPNESGAKLDAGKSHPSLVLGDMHEALKAVIKVSDYGVGKYTEKGWINVPDGEKRYTNAMLRHYLAEQSEDCDADSGLLHAAHLAWNALTRLHFIIERKKNEITN